MGQRGKGEHGGGHGHEHVHGHGHERRFNPANLARLDAPERKERMPPGAIVAAAGLREGMRVADVGAGTGYYTFALLNADPAPVSVDAVDASPEMLGVLRTRAGAHARGERVRLHEGTAEALPLPDRCVDLLVLGNVYHELDDRPRALAEARRVLAPGGRLLLVDWELPADTSQAPEGGPPYAHRLASGAVIDELTRAGFRGVVSHPGFRDVYALTAARD